jgi:hypothetical protein
LDHAIDELSSRERENHVEGIPLLQAECQRDYTGLCGSIAATFAAMADLLVSGDQPNLDDEVATARRVLQHTAQSKATLTSRVDFATAFQPILQPDSVFPQLQSRVSPSLETVSPAITEDIAPYARAIVAFELRLEQYRRELSNVDHQSRSGKKLRTTRASRAALEGGNKASIRKERWFPRETNLNLILATGGPDWQEILLQSNQWLLPSNPQARRRSFSHSPSDSSGDGGT